MHAVLTTLYHQYNNYGSDAIMILYLTLLYATSTLIHAGISVYARFFHEISMNLYTAYVSLMS